VARAERTDLFVEVDPNQKERIILSLKKMGTSSDSSETA
jgi:magnesium-transporting ATPase (P-type)